VNRVNNIVIIEIAKDLESFQFKNEIGDLRTGKLGSSITRNSGQVEQIDACRVHLLELIPDGEGGYFEEKKILDGRNCSRGEQQ
jgi:Tfp pilus assembly protein PilP